MKDGTKPKGANIIVIRRKGTSQHIDSKTIEKEQNKSSPETGMALADGVDQVEKGKDQPSFLG